MKCKGLFITATGTDVGKTFVSALIVKKLMQAGLKTAYYKAALSGVSRKAGGQIESDASYVAGAAGLRKEDYTVSYTYEAALSPHLAAKLEGNPPELSVIRADYEKLTLDHEYIVAEGSGGIVCPIRYDSERIIFLEDIIKTLGLGVLVVGLCALGTINSFVLTMEYLKKKSIPVRGLVCNRYQGGVMEDDNIGMIKSLCKVPVVEIVKENQRDFEMDTRALTELFR
jgi:dethiobiotin synthetase